MHRLNFTQTLPISLAECWDFFSSPNNLELITPKHLGFVMQLKKPEAMYAGQLISHTIRPFWHIPCEWVTEITHVDKPRYFIDQQRFGPYKFWYHEHRFEEVLGGVLVSDIIYYKLYFGVVGKIVNSMIVRRQLASIFTYRKKRLMELFSINNLP